MSTVIRLTAQSDQFAIVLCRADTNNVTEATSTIPSENTCGVGCIVGRYCLLDIVCVVVFLEIGSKEHYKTAKITSLK